jgi:hypothetical protein
MTLLLSLLRKQNNPRFWVLISEYLIATTLKADISKVILCHKSRINF